MFATEFIDCAQKAFKSEFASATGPVNNIPTEQKHATTADPGDVIASTGPDSGDAINSTSTCSAPPGTVDSAIDKSKNACPTTDTLIDNADKEVTPSVEGRGEPNGTESPLDGGELSHPGSPTMEVTHDSDIEVENVDTESISGKTEFSIDT